MLTIDMYIGKVDNLRQQCIQTKFFFAILPMCPLCSMYVFQDDGQTLYGIPIRLNAKSIVAGYLRYYGWAPAVHFFSSTFPEDKCDHVVALRILAGVLLVAYLVLAFGLFGRVYGRQRRQRLLLGKITGYYHHPALFSRDIARCILQDKAPVFASLGITDDPAPWLENHPATEIVPFLYTFALYQYRITRDQDWKRIAQRTFREALGALAHLDVPAAVPNQSFSTYLG